MRALLLSLLASVAAIGGTGSAGADVTTCLGETATIVGTAGNDTLAGTDKDDVIAGLGGDDTITGGGGFDVICAGDGNDSVTQSSGGFIGLAFVGGDAGDDSIQAADRNTLIAMDYEESPAPVNVNLATGTVTGLGTDTLVGINFVVGSAFDDVLAGGSKQDDLIGLAGNDTISGGSGNDLIATEGGDDIVDGGPGRDEVSFSDAPRGVHASLARGTASGDGLDRLHSIEDLTGSKHADVLIGGSGPNTLSGNAGPDRLFGQAGPDHLYGNAGKDRADGGPGKDVCRAENRVRC